MSWPDDADGDVFRRLEASGFDFSVPCIVDYNVDFDSWPPPLRALELLQASFGSVELIETDDDDDSGYVQFQVPGRLSYESVTATQRRVTELMVPYGGVCESWGVMQP